MLQCFVYSESYSGTGSTVFAPIIAYSDKRSFGLGAEITHYSMITNLSINYIKYSDSAHGRDELFSGYIGFGIFNVATAQIGYNSDESFTGRIHGDLGIYSMIKGEPAFFASNGDDKNTIKDNLLLDYSVGYERSGIFGSIGLGFGF